MAATSALPLASALTGCATINAERVNLGSSAIDIHAHFFNGTDLPVAEFLNRVVLTDHSTFESQREFRPKRFREAFFRLLTDILTNNTPTADEERRDIEAGSVTAKSRSVQPDKRAVQNALQRRALRALSRPATQERLRQRSVQPSGSSRPESLDLRDDLLDRINASVDLPPAAAPVPPSQDTAPSAQPLSEGQRKAQLQAQRRAQNRAARTSAQTTANRVFARKADGEYRYTGTIPTALRWAGLLSRGRMAVIDEYVRLYQTATTSSSGEKRLIASSPSIVDFDYWLGIETEQRPANKSNLPSQVAVTSAIARARDDIAILPFAPFDPLREVIGNLTGKSPSLSLVQDAVMKQGFAGVKVYPPMGFRPAGNAGRTAENEAANAVYQRALKRLGKTSNADIGELMDEALNKMFVWAAANNVPIKTHANNSVESQKGGGLKASPAHWREVFKRHETLKVNFAHFGGFEETRACDLEGTGCNAEPQNWEDIIGDMINEGMNVYFDTGYWMDLINDQRRGLSYSIDKTRAFFSKYEKAKAHIMFGTDWSMTGKDPGHERYIRFVDDAIRSLLFTDAEERAYFSGNAIEFLGLRKQRRFLQTVNNNRVRMEEFYSGSKAYRALFDQIDGLA